MSNEPATAPGLNGPWPVLSVEERRVLGVLVEKAKTTPDSYPLTLNATVTGCNQKSNRDPILEMDDLDAETALNRCKAQGLAVKVVGGRTERWRHLLYEAWKLDKIELAIIGELLLRGAQTEGELRTRVSRMESIEDLETLRARVKPLAERNLVVYLTAEDRRGSVVTHGFHSKKELERLVAQHTAPPSLLAPVAAPGASAKKVEPSDERVVALEAAMAKMREEIATLKQQVVALEQEASSLKATMAKTQQELQTLKSALGG